MASDKDNLDKEALALFERSLDQPSEARAEWIAEQAGEDKKLRRQALRFLDRDLSAGSVLNTGGALFDTIDDTQIPNSIGAYRITAIIGHGGMGTVYRGERASGDFDHDVAIKVIRPGVFSDKLITRFLQERQTLASLSHPNIARLYDGGTLDDDAPYIVMEYIDGLPIIKWAVENDASESERLALFLSACDAVSHAHQNLIVHRDISPSNILVDSTGQPKLIDFGIAKISDNDAPTDAPSHSLESLSFTPGFAAPERSRTGGASTLSDIYSLGKLLEALVNRTSQDKDLAAIVAKATREEPDQRYATVDALHDDVERYINGFPVDAAENSTGYRFRKFVLRHKVGSLSAVTGAFILLAAFGLTYVQYRNAEARFNETRELTSFLLNDLPEDLNALPGTLPVLEKIASTSARYLDILAEASESDDSVRFDYAMGRARLGELLTEQGGTNLGKPEEGLENFETSIAILTDLAQEPNASADVRMALGKAQSGAAFAILYHFGETARPTQLLEKSSAIAKKLSRENPDNVDSAVLVASNQVYWAVRDVFAGEDPSSRLNEANDAFKAVSKRFPNNPEIVSKYIGALITMTSVEVDHWTGDRIPLADRRRYNMAIENMKKTSSMAAELIGISPANPNPKLQYVKSVRLYVSVLTASVEWESSFDEKLTALSGAARKGGKAAVRNMLQSDSRFQRANSVRNEINMMINRSDAHLANLAPFDGATFSHIQAVFYNLRTRAYIEALLNFDMETSWLYMDQALAMAEAFAKADPDFRNAHTEIADLLNDRARTLNAHQKIYGGDRTQEICTLLKRSDGIWKMVEKRWGKIKDYEAEKETTSKLIKSHCT